MFKVFAYYTENTPYEQEIKNLIASLDKFGIPRIIKAIPNQGDWQKNTSIKPQLIYDLINEVNHDILYVDADAVFHAYPTIFNNLAADIALHKNKGVEVLSGTVFVKKSEPAMAVISRWVAIQKQQPGVWDQKTLAQALEQSPCRFKELPAQYTAIFDKGIENPIIVHNQASRRFKHVVSKQPEFIMVHGHRARITPDGYYYFPRLTNRLEQQLSKDFVRLPNENLWYAKCGDDKIYELRNIFENKTIHIVGKGPSLDTLTAEDFSDGNPIMCTNEAIHTIEKLDVPNPLFVVQQDHELKDGCKPQRGILLVSFRARRAYEGFSRKYVYYPEHYRAGRTTLTVLMAIKISKQLGCKGYIFHAFDAMKGNTEYSKSIPYPPTRGGDPKRFLNHRNRMLNEVKPLPYECR